MSFGMIFSIILIIAFIGFAFFAIQKFLGIQKIAQTKQFQDDLQTDVTSAYLAAQSSRTVSYNLPSSIVQVCFSDGGNNDLKMYTQNSVQAANIDHLNLTAMIPTGQGEVCFNTNNNKVTFVLKKNFNENLVTITGQNGQ